MTKTLTRHGNSLALVIDRGILELLKIEPDTPLELTTDGRCLIVSPVRSSARQARFGKALSRVNRKHEKALRKLAE